jgi:BON domain-containing protein
METILTTTPLTRFPTAPLPIGVYGPNVSGALPFGPPPAALIVGEANGITAPALLSAVAMRRGQPQGPTNDHEVEDLLYDALELIPGAADVEVRCETGRVTLTGSVQHKRLKRDIGEIAWAIPALSDVQNNVTIASRRRGRGGREAEPSASGSARKQG